MSKEELQAAISAFSEFHVINNDFSDINRQLSKEEDNTVDLVQLVNVQDSYIKRKHQLEVYLEQLSKLEPFLGKSIKDLASSLQDTISSVDNVLNDINDYIETQDSKYVDMILDGISLEKTLNQQFLSEKEICEHRVSLYAFNQTLKKEIELKELTEIVKSLDKDSPITKKLFDVIAASSVHFSRQASVVQEEEVKEEPEQVIEETPAEPTRDDKVAAVTYQEGESLYTATQVVTAEHHMDELSAEIEALEGKDKRTFRENIKLQTLREQESRMQAYRESLEEQKLSRSARGREKGIGKTEQRLVKTQNSLTLSQEKGYNSSIMRFFSTRYQEQLQADIIALQQKSGMLQGKQKASAVANYDAAERKMTRGTKFLGTVRAFGEAASNKLEQLKQFKNKVTNEFAMLRDDMSRFSSQRGQIEELQNRQGLLLNDGLSIEGRHQMLLTGGLYR